MRISGSSEHPTDVVPAAVALSNGGLQEYPLAASRASAAGDQNDLLILVDEQDREVGLAEKLSVHREGRLHRAFSVFLFNASGELLLQRRALTKYHSGGLWSNTCCSHPAPGELLVEAASTRLEEEMGISCRLREAFEFTYRARVGNGLLEFELDHVFVGHYEGSVFPNSAEVMDCKWISHADLAADLSANPGSFTPWLGVALEAAAEHGHFARAALKG